MMRNITEVKRRTVSGLLCAQSASEATPGVPTRAAVGESLVAGIWVSTSRGVTSGIQSVLQDLGAKVTAHEVKIEMNADVLFDFDKYNLKS